MNKNCNGHISPYGQALTKLSFMYFCDVSKKNWYYFNFFNSRMIDLWMFFSSTGWLRNASPLVKVGKPNETAAGSLFSVSQSPVPDRRLYRIVTVQVQTGLTLSLCSGAVVASATDPVLWWINCRARARSRVCIEAITMGRQWLKLSKHFPFADTSLITWQISIHLTFQGRYTSALFFRGESWGTKQLCPSGSARIKAQALSLLNYTPWGKSWVRADCRVHLCVKQETWFFWNVGDSSCIQVDVNRHSL